MKVFLLFFSMQLISISVFCQRGSIYAQLNYNTFSHTSLKSFQNQLIDDVPEVTIKTNDAFPANLGFTFGYKIESISTSLFFSYNTTGGKISYSDYSGVIRVTQPLEGYTIGGNYQIKLLKTSKNNNDLFIGFKGLCTYSTFSIESYSQVLDDINEDSFDLYSIDYGIGVNLIYEYKLSFFKIMATAGFDAVLGGKLFFKENKDYHLEDEGGDKVNTGWSGLRTGIGISIPL